MSLKSTGLGHVPRTKQSLPPRTRPLIFTHNTLAPRAFTGQLVMGDDAVVKEAHSEPTSPVLLNVSTQSFHSAVEASAVLNAVFIATIGDRDKWGPDVLSRGTFTSADLRALTGIQYTKAAFLPNFSYLRRVDLAPLASVVTVGDNFLLECTSLDHLDISPLRGAKSIGSSFLARCSSLGSIDLQCLSQVESVAAEFISHCVGLRDVSIAGMTALARIDDGFLRGCTSVTVVTLTAADQPVRLIRALGACFLSNCTQLVAVDLTTFARLKTVPSYFLSGCTALRHVSLRSFSAATRIESYFLWGCTALKVVELPKSCKVEQIGAYFLSGCLSLESLDMSLFTRLAKIGCGFLSGCTFLRAVQLSGLPPLAEVGSHFLAGCASLPGVDLHALSRLEHLEDCFLFQCRSMVRLDLSPLARVISVGHYFLSGCTALHHLDLQPMAGLRHGQSFFLADCGNLATLDLTPVRQLQIGGGGMLDGCTQLRVLHATSLQQLAGLDGRFLERVPVELVLANTPEAAECVASATKGTAAKCVICIKPGKTLPDDELPPSSHTDGSRVSKSTCTTGSGNSATLRPSDSSSPPPTEPHRHVDCFARTLVLHQQSRVWVLERQVGALRTELETVTRRLGAFNTTAQKDMTDASRLLFTQKVRLDELQLENEQLRHAAATSAAAPRAAEPEDVEASPAASPSHKKRPTLTIQTRTESPPPSAPPQQQQQQQPVIKKPSNLKILSLSLPAADPRKDKPEGASSTLLTPPPLQPQAGAASAPRGRSSSVGQWITGWFRQAPPESPPPPPAEGDAVPAAKERQAKTSNELDFNSDEDVDHDV